MPRAFESTPIEDLTEADLAALVAAQAEESRTLDAKRDAYGGSDADKRELARDLTSFANTVGGDLLIGVDEQNGKLSAIPALSGDPDALIVRYQVAEKTVYTMAQKAELSCFKVRGQWRFRWQDLDAWIASQVAVPVSSHGLLPKAKAPRKRARR